MNPNPDSDRSYRPISADNTLPDKDEYSVSEFTQRLQALLERALPSCWIHGEISNFTEAGSGHWYFNLKEAQAQIRCVMFRFRQGGSNVRPANGLAVRLRGSLTWYAPNGTCQILVEQLRPAGQGALFEAFNRLKQRYAEAGYFSEARKRVPPPYPATVGVLTSPTGAAWRDIVTTLKRRAPHVALLLYPIPVQGEGAAAEIAQRLAQAGARREVDVLLLCRGGGSMEDLWAFNEPPVVEAMLACPLPIIAGIGHETDVTLADFVADRRAATPTAAAELVHPERQVLLQQLSQIEKRFGHHVQHRLERALLHLETQRMRWERSRQQHWQALGDRLQQLAQRLIHPAQRLATQQQHLNGLHLRWLPLGQRRLDVAQRQLSLLALRWDQASRAYWTGQHQQLTQRAQTLQHLNPHAVLGRGYALVQNHEGQVIDRVALLMPHEKVRITLGDGSRTARIEP